MDEIHQHLQTLGLKPNATQDQAKQAYRDLMMVWHPDRFPANSRLQQSAQEMTKAINIAYQTLISRLPQTEPRTERVRRASSNPRETPHQNTTGTDSSERAILITSEGEMVLEFWPEVAPGHVENVKKLARQGFYDGTCFHRVIKGFTIQGGDPLTKDEANKSRWGTGGPGYQINAEFNDKAHVRGVLSMARSNDPNSAGSQFFICHGDPRFLDKQYTAFGRIIKGDDVLEKIATTPTEPGDRPVKRMNIDSVKIVPAGSVK